MCSIELGKWVSVYGEGDEDLDSQNDIVYRLNVNFHAIDGCR